MAKRGSLCALLFLAGCLTWAQPRRKVIINEDCSGPGGSNLQTLLLLIQSGQADVLGITVVSGDQWLEEEVSHTLRLLEIIGRTDIPVMKGAACPLVHTREEALLRERLYGKVSYKGAWDERGWHDADVVPPMPEGKPTAKPAGEDAAHFLVRMVRKYPHEVTIYEGGPMTNLATALTIDPHFAELAEGLVFMGGSLNPETRDPEFANNPRHEFNFWFDPEAAHVVLRAPWKKIVCTTTDISIKTRLTQGMVDRMAASGTPAGRYIARFFKPGDGNDYMWDELAAAAWLDPILITRKEIRFLSVDINHGASYGNTLTWTDDDKPAVTVRPVEIQVDLDKQKFEDMFVKVMSTASK
jgi:purine nucleosidase